MKTHSISYRALVLAGLGLLATSATAVRPATAAELLLAGRDRGIFCPRGQDLQPPRGQDTERPRGQDIQTPRGQDTERPRGQDIKAPRGQDTERPRGADVKARTGFTT